jgi:hypothetical protein
MLLLAYRLLKKKFPATWKAARKRGKTKKNMGGEPKETAVSRENVPADGSNPAQCNEAGISAHPHLRPSDQSAAYLSPTEVAKSKVRCHLSNAAAPSLRCTIFWARPLDFICAATSRRDVPRSWRSRRLQRDIRERPRSLLVGLGSHRRCTTRCRFANRHACLKRVTSVVLCTRRRPVHFRYTPLDPMQARRT